jgi:hypothetical protein
MNTQALQTNFATQSLLDTVVQTKTFRISALVLLLALLSACGSKVTPRADQLYSGSGPTPSTPVVNPAGAGQAQCSLFDSSSTRLGGKVTTYYYNGIIQEDKVRVRITSLVENFDADANYYIQAFRWKVVGGTSEIDETPLQFTLEKGAGSASPISEPISSLNGTKIAQLRSSASISGTGAVDFFSKTTMVVSGVDYNWQAMKIVVYNGTKVVGQADFLLPVFEANPNRYAATHHATLNSLHPFWAQRSQTLSESEWASRSQSFCF